MDLARLADYEILYPLDILWKDQPTGLKMQIRSASSAAVKEVMRKHSRKNLERVQKGKLINEEQTEAAAVEKAAACIASWEWTGEANYQGGKPELSMKTAMAMLAEWDWIFDQVVAVANNLDFFSAGSAKR